MRPRLRTSPGRGVPGSQRYPAAVCNWKLRQSLPRVPSRPGWWGRGHPGAVAAVLAHDHDHPAPAEGKEGYTVKVAAVRSVEEPRPPQCHQMLVATLSI